MKTFTQFLTLAAFVCFAQVATAQTVNKGAWMLGGNVGFTSSKVKDADASLSVFTIAPDVAYYIADDLAIGLALNFTSVSFDGNSNSSTSVGPSVRYYVADPIFVTVGAALGLDEGAGTSIYAGVGYSWFLNNSVAIEPMLFYQSNNNDGDLNDSSDFGLQIGVRAFVGRN